MTNRTQTKQQIESGGLRQEVRRDLRAWRILYGLWRGKKIKNPVLWQRKIREESERKLI